jgi:hypothetical protein
VLKFIIAYQPTSTDSTTLINNMTAVLHDTRSGFDPLTRPGKDFSSTPHRLGGAAVAPPAAGTTQPKGTGGPKVVADDYMYEFAYPVDLPTIDRYDVKLDSFQDPNQVATEWLRDFSSAMTSCDGSKFAELFLPDGRSKLRELIVGQAFV